MKVFRRKGEERDLLKKKIKGENAISTFDNAVVVRYI